MYFEKAENYYKLSFEELWLELDLMKVMQSEGEFIIVKIGGPPNRFLHKAVNCTTEVYSEEEIISKMFDVSKIPGKFSFPSSLQKAFSNECIV